MSSNRKKSKKSRKEVPTMNSLPNLPSLYAESSEVTPHFRDKVETLTDSEDETKSNSSDSVEGITKNERADENPWGFNDSDMESLKNSHVEPVIECNPKKNKKRKSAVDIESDDFRPQKKKKKEKDKDDAAVLISSKAEKMMVCGVRICWLKFPK